ncbi:hypothetical protein F2Q70_00003810 [Brassica cretica]|uniref:Retrotransposon gag domain-containing protein n=1 Tax=Brassica cretica TaxID=69181 RepID=A0A8S9IQX5_BRACR|nr:hypothetical protein F2Q70_00003810 [Brassica cretica]
MRVGWSRVTSLSNLVLIPPFLFPCAQDFKMFSLDHYEWRMPRMHYGRRNTREYARRRHRDMEGNWVLPMFTDPEEQYMEFPFRYPHEQTVRRKVLMPHFPRMSMEERILQGHARFQLATEEEPLRKRGRPCKTLSAAGGPPRAFTGKCQCGVLIQNAQENRSVAGYTEEFINQAKLCKPKNAKTWCGWYKNGLHKDIQAQLRGVLEPLEFALVRRMAGFAMEAEEKIAANVAAALSSIEEGNPGREAEGQEVPVGGLAKGKRGRPWKPSTETCVCDVLVQMVQKPRKVRDYQEEFLDTAKRCQPKPAQEWCQLFRAGLRGDIQEWLAEGEAEAEYDRFAEGDEDLGPKTRCASPYQCG